MLKYAVGKRDTYGPSAFLSQAQEQKQTLEFIPAQFSPSFWSFRGVLGGTGGVKGWPRDPRRSYA